MTVSIIEPAPLMFVGRRSIHHPLRVIRNHLGQPVVPSSHWNPCRRTVTLFSDGRSFPGGRGVGGRRFSLGCCGSGSPTDSGEFEPGSDYASAHTLHIAGRSGGPSKILDATIGDQNVILQPNAPRATVTCAENVVAHKSERGACTCHTGRQHGSLVVLVEHLRLSSSRSMNQDWTGWASALSSIKSIK